MNYNTCILNNSAIFGVRLNAIQGINRQSIISGLTLLRDHESELKNTRYALKRCRVSFFNPYLRLLYRSRVVVPHLSLAQEREFKELCRGFIILLGNALFTGGVDAKANEHRTFLSILERSMNPFRDWYIYSGLQARMLRVMASASKQFKERERYRKFLEDRYGLSKKKKKGEVTLEDTWKTRASKLKTSYRDYLKSDHWRKLKIKTKRRKKYKKCLFCSCTKVELHHTTYKWIYTKKELIAIMPVCRKHHQEIHTFAVSQNMSVRLASNAIVRRYKLINS